MKWHLSYLIHVMWGLNAALHAENGVDLEGRLMKKLKFSIFEWIVELTPKCFIQSWLWPPGVLHAKCGLIWKVRKTSRFSHGFLCHFKNIHLTLLGSMGIIVYITREVLRSFSVDSEGSSFWYFFDNFTSWLEDATGNCDFRENYWIDT